MDLLLAFAISSAAFLISIGIWGLFLILGDK
jgi:hypothetical protein